MNKIITISREFGSGGREIGKRLADELEFSYYDSEIITEIAKQTGMTEIYVENISEKGIYTHPFQFGKSFTTIPPIQNNQTEILVATQKVLKEIAENGNAVIVGRAANVILKEYNPMNIFVYSDIETKIRRCREKANEEEKNLTDKEFENKINKIDKNRINYHKIISNLEWGDKKNYHLCINTSNVEIKSIIPTLACYTKEWFRGK